MDLVSFRGVGRSRARILFEKGIRTRSDVMATPYETLAAIPRIGPSLARSMKDQTGSVTDMVQQMSPSEEEALLDAMAADYGELPEEPVETKQEPVKTETPKKTKKVKKVEETGQKQASLFDF